MRRHAAPLPAAESITAARTAGRAGANSTTAAAAANGRSIEDIDLVIAADIKVRQASEARLAALFAERKACSTAERPAA